MIILLISTFRNLPIWAWSDEETVQQFILNSLVTLIHQSSALLTNDVVAYLLSFLIEPAKSSQPRQHTMVKDLIVRTAAQLEYPIQMVSNPALFFPNFHLAHSKFPRLERPKVWV